MALMHLKVYYKFCPETVENLAVFPRTVSGPDLTSLEEATGTCVDNAAMVSSMLIGKNYIEICNLSLSTKY